MIACVYIETHKTKGVRKHRITKLKLRKLYNIFKFIIIKSRAHVVQVLGRKVKFNSLAPVYIHSHPEYLELATKIIHSACSQEREK